MKHHVEDERLLDEFQTETLNSIIAAQFFIIRNNLKNFFRAFTGFQETHKILDCFLFVIFVSSFHYEVILIRKKTLSLEMEVVWSIYLTEKFGFSNLNNF